MTLQIIPGDLRLLVMFVVGILVGLGMLAWLLTGHELMRIRSRLGGVAVQFSPLLTRVASAMMALMLMVLSVLIFPDSPLQGPASLVGVVAALAFMLCIIIGAAPQTHGWGRRNH